jgi:predicted nucleic acid-binding protein
MVIVDSMVWIDYFRGVDHAHSLWLDAQSQHLRLGLTDLSLCEALQGIRDERELIATRAELLEFAIFATGDAEFALQAADNLQKLRRKEFTIRRIADRWIATFAPTAGSARQPEQLPTCHFLAGVTSDTGKSQ